MGFEMWAYFAKKSKFSRINDNDNLPYCFGIAFFAAYHREIKTEQENDNFSFDFAFATYIYTYTIKYWKPCNSIEMWDDFSCP